MKNMGIYLKSRFTRSILGYILAILLAALSIFGCFYSWLIESKESDRNNAYSLPSEIVISSVKGTYTDNLAVVGIYLRTFTKYKDGFTFTELPDLYPYFSEVRLLVKLACWTLEDYELYCFDGISSKSMIECSEVVWLTDELDFEDYNNEGVLLPKTLFDSLPEGENSFSAILYPSEDKMNSCTEAELTVAGYYTGGDGGTIYCPFEQAIRLGNEMEGFIGSASSISAIVADNTKLDEIRKLLQNYFCEVSPSGYVGKDLFGNEYRFAAIIHDEELRQTVNTLSRSIDLLKRLYPLVLFAEMIIAFASCWFYIYIIRREIAVARSLGTSVYQILWVTGAEMAILSLLSLILTLAVVSVLPFCVTDWAVSSIIIASGIAGALLSAIIAARNNGTRILRED